MKNLPAFFLFFLLVNSQINGATGPLQTLTEPVQIMHYIHELNAQLSEHSLHATFINHFILKKNLELISFLRSKTINKEQLQQYEECWVQLTKMLAETEETITLYRHSPLLKKITDKTASLLCQDSIIPTTLSKKKFIDNYQRLITTPMNVHAKIIAKITNLETTLEKTKKHGIKRGLGQALRPLFIKKPSKKMPDPSLYVQALLKHATQYPKPFISKKAQAGLYNKENTLPS